MLRRIIYGSTLFSALLGFTACSGGSGGGGTGASSTCAEASSFCLSSCNLGCVQDGCELREIAQNQLLRFQFSQDVDPRTVDLNTISLRTPLGLEPAGTFVVEGAVVTFIPEVRSIGAQTFFGFTPNAEYILDLPGRDTEPALRSTSGDPLVESFTCSLNVTQGLIDLDASPPVATVILPSSTSEISRNSTFVLEFSEVVDQSPFIISPTGPDAPVQFLLLPRASDGSCRLDADPSRIFGTVRIEDDAVANSSTLTFTPSQALPGNRCVEVRVTGGVRDIAGTPASPQSFVFTTDVSSIIEDVIEVDLTNADNIDLTRSAGLVDNNEISFLSLGGDGRHGDFRIEDGVFDADTGAWVFNTGAPVPGNFNGFVRNEIANGDLHYTRFIIPAGEIVRFTGAFPAQIHVRGECDVRGQLLFSGRDQSQFTAIDNPADDAPGQLGSAGGPGGGRGGNGGQQCDGNGDLPINDGGNGDDVQVPNTHAFAGSAAGTGGRGGEVFPIDGLATSALPTIFSFSGQAANGGSGGGFIGAGGIGRVIEPGLSATVPQMATRPAANNPGGSNFPFTPLPTDTRTHFLVGGSGGGGGGSHPFYQTAGATAPDSPYIAASGGSGGGGAANFRIGRSFGIQPGGLLESRGGDNFLFQLSTGINQPLACPAGGGSGGSILVQLARNDQVTLLGSLNVRGGRGGVVRLAGSVFAGHVVGGDGATGVYRFEAPVALSTAWPLTTDPAPNSTSSGVLNDRDDVVGVMSRVLSTGLAVAPIYVRYELEARVNGVLTTYSDDMNVGIPALPGQAVQFLVQGVDLDPASGLPVEGTFTPEWFRRVGSSPTPGEASLNESGRPGFRWQVLADRAVAGGPVEVLSVKVVINF